MTAQYVLRGRDGSKIDELLNRTYRNSHIFDYVQYKQRLKDNSFMFIFLHFSQ